MSSSSDALDSAFQVISHDGTVGSIVYASDASGNAAPAAPAAANVASAATTTNAPAPPLSSAATTANVPALPVPTVVVTNAPVVPAPNATAVPAPIAPVVPAPSAPVVPAPSAPVAAAPNAPVVAGPNAPAVAAPTVPVAAAPNAPVVAGPAAAAIPPFAPWVITDINERRAGKPLGFIPASDLVPGDVPTDRKKYYAVARGRFIGVFSENAKYGLAVNMVSAALYDCPTTLGAALAWFNEMRAMGLCEIVQ